MKKTLLALVLALLALLGASALADEGRTVIFEGEAAGKFTNYNSWKNALILRLASAGIDTSIFSSEFNIEVEYEGENAPTLFFMSWTGGTSKAQIEAASTDGKTAVFTYADIRRAYGNEFDRLGSISLRPNLTNIVIRKVTVVSAAKSEQAAVRFEGKAGEWLASINAGWNLGNTFESWGTWIGNNKASSKYETAWGNPVTTREMIQTVADAGFSVIRMPVTWYQHMNADGVIDAEWMDRVNEVVDWCVDAGLKVILNVHHDNGDQGWMRADLTRMDEIAPRSAALWTQIAERFRDYDDCLALESFNEILDANANWGNPSADACEAVNQLNQLFVDTVRATGGCNATRVLIVNTYAATSDDNALSGFVLPTDTVENSLIAEVHVYSPWDYCNTIGNGNKADDWNAVNGKSAINQILNRLYTHLTSKGIPVLIGEFAAGAKHNESNRAEWAAYLVEHARAEGIPCVWWDNGGQVKGSADDYLEMGLLNRRTLEWLYPEIVEAITGVDVRVYQSLASLAEDDGFKMGACYSFYQMKDQRYLELMKQNYNSITPTNELKAYSLLDRSATRSRTDGMPGLNWYQADQMLAWAQESGISVRGHVLVWDAYMTDWFFREDYSTSKPYADPATVRERMAWYINEVITHCETKFPGVVYCWDVVNEAVGDSNGEYEANDPRHLRTLRAGAPNLFRECAGDDYVEYAFLCARNTVDALGADIKLFYNDYNTYQTGKRAAITELMKSINSYAQDENGQPRKLADGVGMQCYVGGYGTQNGCMNDADIEAIRKSILHYGSLGLEVHITEMSIRNYQDDAEAVADHAAYCGRLFSMLKGINTADSRILTCVAMWGITDCNSLPSDHYTWKLNGPYCGLFTEGLEKKDAFKSVYEALK